MLKRRLVACLIVKRGIVVQSRGFHAYLPIGRPRIVIEFLNRFGVDEIILLNIDATPDGGNPEFNVIPELSAKCYVPLTVGGGIRSVSDMLQATRCGADKISINTAALERPSLIDDAAQVLGSQCIIVSLDVKRLPDGSLEVYSHGGRQATGRHPVAWAIEATNRGAGELLVNSIDRDGSKLGYDLELIQDVSRAVGIPVIGCGGAGHPGHILDAFSSTGVSAAAVGNMLHFSEHSVITIKAFLKSNGIQVRLDSHADYSQFQFDSLGRVAKQGEGILDRQRFVRHTKEEI